MTATAQPIINKRQFNRLSIAAEYYLIKYIENKLTQSLIDQNKMTIGKILKWLNEQSSRPWMSYMTNGVKLTEDNVRGAMEVIRLRPYKGQITATQCRTTVSTSTPKGDLIDQIQEMITEAVIPIKARLSALESHRITDNETLETISKLTNQFLDYLTAPEDR